MKHNKVVAIIQARMTSTRLPGKVLKRIGDKSILEILVNRLKRAKRISLILVATTKRKEDDKIVELLKKLGVEWYRGSEDDVLKRYIDASKVAGADVVVRVTADNPLTDPELMDELIEAHLESEADYTHCVRTPLGISAEVVNRDILERIDSIAKDAEYREHVTLYIREHPELFKIHVAKAEELGLNYPDLRLTVDTKEDLELMRKLQENLGDLEKLEIREVVEFLDKHPEIRRINAQVEQKLPNSADSPRSKVSVIIRTHNSAKFVRNAVDSVLSQTPAKKFYEILVIDDGSTDATKKLLKSYGDKIRLMEKQGLGPIKAANLGIEHSRCEYVIFLDSDDAFEPNALEQMLNAIQNSDADFVHCDYYEKNMENGEVKTISLKDNIFNSVAGGILFKKSLLKKLGGYDEGLVFPEYDLLIKLTRKKCRYEHVAMPLFTYVRHKGSLTSDKEIVKKGFKQLFDRYGEIKGLRDY